mmetsp:Transcript_12758/g.36063  ORF Transcript_12758/g.36063 Transcript_12758/m.36063 type:complete len:245 (-) Transcript_12758:418-1152(-)
MRSDRSDRYLFETILVPVNESPNANNVPAEFSKFGGIAIGLLQVLHLIRNPTEVFLPVCQILTHRRRVFLQVALLLGQFILLRHDLRQSVRRHPDFLLLLRHPLPRRIEFALPVRFEFPLHFFDFSVNFCQTLLPRIDFAPELLDCILRRFFPPTVLLVCDSTIIILPAELLSDILHFTQLPLLLVQLLPNFRLFALLGDDFLFHLFAQNFILLIAGRAFGQILLRVQNKGPHKVHAEVFELFL